MQLFLVSLYKNIQIIYLKIFYDYNEIFLKILDDHK